MDEPDDLGRALHDPHLGRRAGGRARPTSSAPSRPLRGRAAGASGCLARRSVGATDGARSAISRHDGRVGERRRVAERAVLGDVAEQAAHDLPRARLRQLRREDDVRRLRDRADLVRDVVAELLEHLDRARVGALERDVGDDRLAGRRVRAAADGGLGDLRDGRRAPTRPRSSRCGDPRRSSRRRRGRGARSRRRRRSGRRRPRSRGRGSAPSTSRGSARRRRRSRASSRATAARGRGSRRPARRARPARSAPPRDDAGERLRRRAGLRRRDPGERRDHDHPRLGLPPRVDDGAAARRRCARGTRSTPRG